MSNGGLHFDLPAFSMPMGVAELDQAIERLSLRLREVEEFQPSSVEQPYNDPKVMSLSAAISTTLADVFTLNTHDYRAYSDASSLAPIYAFMNRNTDRYYITEQFTIGKNRSIGLLKGAIKHLSEKRKFAAIKSDEETLSIIRPLSKQIFVVHGHDGEAKQTIARYLERLGFEPIVLHEQANQGRTVIEKIEAFGDVGFAVVLLTPDDVGGKVGGDMHPRARQNVVLELGYFVGRLGRGHVCALLRGDIEIPSDFSGVVYQAMDDGGGWKAALAKELAVVGYEFDWSMVVK